MKELFELSGNVMKDAIIEDGLLEPLRMKWQNAKTTNLEYYITNVNTQCGPNRKVGMLEHIQSHLTIPMSLGSKRP